LIKASYSGKMCPFFVLRKINFYDAKMIDLMSMGLVSEVQGVKVKNFV